jgi:DNA-binding transcriptional ArsR family regulator
MEVLQLADRAGEAAELLAAMAHRKRLMILCYLLNDELSVNALAERLDIAQPTLSQHLAKLRDLRLVAPRRDGNLVYYRLASSEVEQVLRALHSAYCT